MRYYFIIICINLVLIPINAQKITRVSNFREVVVIKGDTVIRTYILTEDAKKDPDLQRQYYWYSNGIINSNKGGYSGKLLHNGYEAFVNNNLIESGNFKKGVKTGKWLVWWESGSIRKISTYEDGVLNGKYTVLKENGDVELDGIYRKGKFHLSGKASLKKNKGIRAIIPKFLKNRKQSEKSNSGQEQVNKESKKKDKKEEKRKKNET